MSLNLIDPRLKLRHLRCFLEVARLGGVAKAASALNMSQPAATKTIQELVQVIDTKIFGKLFFYSCLCQDVLHNRNGSKFFTFLEENGLVDGREVLQDVYSFIRKFHNYQ